jgi:predicted membrane protein
MSNLTNRSSMISQVVLGIAAIGFGCLFLLDNLTIWDFQQYFRFWPAIFVILGVVKLLDTNSPKGRFLGVVMIAVGGWMTLNQLGFLHFRLRDVLFPMIMIGVGLLVVFKGFTGRRLLDAKTPVPDGTDATVDTTAILGGFQRRITSQNFRGGEISAMLGGCELDLREASIEGEPAVINVFAMMGGITLKVPTDWTVILNGTPIMGGFEEKTVMPKEGTKKLIVKGYAIMGGVEVRN